MSDFSNLVLPPGWDDAPSSGPAASEERASAQRIYVPPLIPPFPEEDDGSIWRSPMRRRYGHATRMPQLAADPMREPPMFASGNGAPKTTPWALHTSLNMDLGDCREALSQQVISDEMVIYPPLEPRPTVPPYVEEEEEAEAAPEGAFVNPYADELDENWSLF